MCLFPWSGLLWCELKIWTVKETHVPLHSFVRIPKKKKKEKKTLLIVSWSFYLKLKLRLR